jgi:hypothetical protein
VPERAGAGEEEEGAADADVGQLEDVPFEYICEGYCQKKASLFFLAI